MDEFMLTNEIISKVKKEAFDSAHRLMGTDLVKMILYGSCARGDYTKDSDVDIALLTKCNRMEVKKYDDALDAIATQLAMKYFAIELLAKGSYKSANNRAFYAIEKGIKALLAIVGIEAQTHSGSLKQFNFEFIFYSFFKSCTSITSIDTPHFTKELQEQNDVSARVLNRYGVL